MKERSSFSMAMRSIWRYRTRVRYVSFVGLLTPYAQVVAHSQAEISNYSAQQAEHYYESEREKVCVTVHLEFTATYTALKDQKSTKDNSRTKGFAFRPPDFWRDFRFELRQRDELINLLDIQGTPLPACRREI